VEIGPKCMRPTEVDFLRADRSKARTAGNPRWALTKIWETRRRGQAAVAVWGTGELRGEFLYSDDMEDACRLLMGLVDGQFDQLTGEEHAPLINIGCGQDLSIRELAETVAGCGRIPRRVGSRHEQTGWNSPQTPRLHSAELTWLATCNPTSRRPGACEPELSAIETPSISCRQSELSGSTNVLRTAEPAGRILSPNNGMPRYGEFHSSAVGRSKRSPRIRRTPKPLRCGSPRAPKQAL
jgi:hypothetical protein